MKYLVNLKYDGKFFYGWGIQPTVKTVQGEVENSLKTILGKKTRIVVGGRTDRYVHAKDQYFTFESNSKKVDSKLKKALNNNLTGIKIIKITKVDPNFILSDSIQQKTYLYKVKVGQNTSFNDYHHTVVKKLDHKKMKKASKWLIGTLDFASFTIKKENYGTTIRTVNNIKIRHFGKTTHISFTGEGFMRFQVRNLAGALLAHNRGNLTDIELKELISLPEKGKCHWKAPGSGLYLQSTQLK